MVIISCAALGHNSSEVPFWKRREVTSKRFIVKVNPFETVSLAYIVGTGEQPCLISTEYYSVNHSQLGNPGHV